MQVQQLTAAACMEVCSPQSPRQDPLYGAGLATVPNARDAGRQSLWRLQQLPAER